MSRTSIPINSETKDRLSRLKRSDETWDDFLTRLAGEDEPIRVGAWSDEDAEAVRESINRSRESFGLDR